MACNDYEAASSGVPAGAVVSCARCGTVIAGAVHVALVLEEKWDDWAEEWGEWEDLWWPREVCAACFGDRRVRYRTACARCGREVVGAAEVCGASRTYCSGPCRWAAEDERAGRHREGRTKACGWCGVDFVARRSDARFCSGRCRVAAHRSAPARPREHLS